MKIKLNDWKWCVSKDKIYIVETNCFNDKFFIDDVGDLWYIDIERDWSNCLISEVIEE